MKEDAFRPTFKALAALLDYPRADLREALPDVDAIIVAQRGFRANSRATLRALVAEIASLDPLEAEERYVALFDRGRATSLNLFEHVHGESRDRGQAMVDLRQVYERAGLDLATGELPDYLPVMLEFLSQRPFAEAKAMLADCAAILRSIGEALARRDSRYAGIPAALLDLAGEPALDVAHALTIAPAPEQPLDEAWAEAPAFDGLGTGCVTTAPGRAAPLTTAPGRAANP
jgi:nitrate reductase delta subunit